MMGDWVDVRSFRLKVLKIKNPAILLGLILKTAQVHLELLLLKEQDGIKFDISRISFANFPPKQCSVSIAEKCVGKFNSCFFFFGNTFSVQQRITQFFFAME